MKMKIKGIIFDFGFTLFFFENPSVEKYYDCFNRGLVEATKLLKESEILTEDNSIDYFLKVFKRKRAHFFKKSIKDKNEYTTPYIFQFVLDMLVEKEIIKELEEKGVVIQYK